MPKLKFFVAATVAAVLAVVVPAQGQQPQRWEFDTADRVEIDGVSGDLMVRAGTGSGIVLELVQEVRPADAFRAEVDSAGSTVRVRERWEGRSSSSQVRWTLTIPAGSDLMIAFDTASGDLDASGVTARFSFDTASGDVRLSDMTIAHGSSFDTASGNLILTDVVVGDDVDMDTASGDVELRRVRAGSDFAASTASGDVSVEDSEGVLRASSASGSVRVDGRSRLTGPSEFSSASGDVTVVLDAVPVYELEASSASGDVSLEAALEGDFTLVMSKRRDRGRIDSPFEPTSEEEYTRNGQRYIRQTVVHGSGGPEIRLHTASGSIRVRGR